jgi:phosphoglycerate dehydrogenase-like enzyme
MRIATGKVIRGKLELDGDSLEEGATVTVLVPESDETFTLTPDEEVALEESLKQAARGEFVDADALLRELRQ